MNFPKIATQITVNTYLEVRNLSKIGRTIEISKQGLKQRKRFEDD